MDKALHYEIHVTVRTNEVQRFIDECGALGVKPIVLDLQLKDGSGAIQDVMTSSKLTGDDAGAWNRMKDIAWYLSAKGFEVVRQKIETVPWHTKAAVHDKDSKEGYFEAHIPVVVNPRYADDLARVAEVAELHLSRNPFKTYHDGRYVQMVTLRKNMRVEDFERRLKVILNFIDQAGFFVSKKPEVEYALYDSNVQHDAAWINS